MPCQICMASHTILGTGHKLSQNPAAQMSVCVSPANPDDHMIRAAVGLISKIWQGTAPVPQQRPWASPCPVPRAGFPQTWQIFALF